MNEFDLIQQYFAQLGVKNSQVDVGIGDDCAVMQLAPDEQLVFSVDTINQHSHFPSQAKPADIGYRALAVALSDLAAMGATPKWVGLSMCFPEFNPDWLSQFCSGFNELLLQHQCQLIGGDTTQGPLSICVQVFGAVPKGLALLRRGARVGDWVCVSGFLGSAALGLDFALQTCNDKIQDNIFLKKYYRPNPRIQLGLDLRHLATSCTDISDGLCIDLENILQASRVGAKINIEKLPIHPELFDYYREDRVYELALTHGDDYELCFTIPKHLYADLVELTQQKITIIGEIIADQELTLLHHQKSIQLNYSGFQHFTRSS
ncbi:MAG: thiamine-phosphate kinase [Legionellales bacterium]|nr:thiamine-phosphate kinase [Legionellales bacterium]